MSAATITTPAAPAPAAKPKPAKAGRTLRIGHARLGPHQVRIIDDRSKVVVVRMTRRGGKDYAVASKIVGERLDGTKSSNVIYQCQREDNGRQFILQCEAICRELGHAVQVLGFSDPFTVVNENGQQQRPFQAWKIVLPSRKKGGRNPEIIVLSSHPDAARGHDGDLIMSEFAFYATPEANWDAGTPCTSLGGQVIVISTPNRQGDFFEQLTEMGRRRAAGMPNDGDIPVSLHEATVLDVARNGYLDVINRARGTTLTPEQFIADCRDIARNNEVYDREYMCVASVDGLAYIPEAMIRANTSKTAPMPFDFDAEVQFKGRDRSAELVRREMDQRCELSTEDFIEIVRRVLSNRPGAANLYAGIDIGRKTDLFVLWLWASVGERRVTVGVLRWRGATFAAMEKACHRVLGHVFDVIDDQTRRSRAVRVARSSGDNTGMGMQLCESLTRKFHSRFEAVNFTLESKTDLATRLKALFEQGLCEIPDCPRVRSAIGRVRKHTLPGGQDRFDAEADQDGHADEFWAAALGLRAAEMGKSVGRLVSSYGDGRL